MSNQKMIHFLKKPIWLVCTLESAEYSLFPKAEETIQLFKKKKNWKGNYGILIMSFINSILNQSIFWKKYFFIHNKGEVSLQKIFFKIITVEKSYAIAISSQHESKRREIAKLQMILREGKENRLIELTDNNLKRDIVQKKKKHTIYLVFLLKWKKIKHT